MIFDSFKHNSARYLKNLLPALPFNVPRAMPEIDNFGLTLRHGPRLSHLPAGNQNDTIGDLGFGFDYSLPSHVLDPISIYPFPMGGISKYCLFLFLVVLHALTTGTGLTFRTGQRLNLESIWISIFI